MKKLFAVLAITVSFLSACKKEPIVIIKNINTNTIDSSTVITNPVKTLDGVYFYENYTQGTSVWISDITGSATYGYTAADLSAYGSNLAGVKFNITFKLHYKVPIMIDFDVKNFTPQYLDIDYPNTSFDMWSNGAEKIATANNGNGEYTITIKNEMLVTKTVGSTKAAMRGFMESFKYKITDPTTGNDVVKELPIKLVTDAIQI